GVGRERDFRALGQARAEQPGLLADADAAVGAVGRGQQRPAPLARGRVEGALVVARRRVHAVGLDPDLQEVDRPGIAGVVFAVFDAVAGAHPLQLARTQHAAATAAVAVRERPGQHVAEDFHVGVPVRRETAARLHPVLVDHAQRAEAHPRGIVVMPERERVPAVEPAGAHAAALGGRAFDDHRAQPLALASVVMRSSTSSLAAGTYMPIPNSERLMVVVASKPTVGTLPIGCGAALLRVTSSTTGRVTPGRVRSPATCSRPSPRSRTEVLLKRASGKFSASKKSALSRCLSRSATKLVRPDSGSITSTFEFSGASAS